MCVCTNSASNHCCGNNNLSSPTSNKEEGKPQHYHYSNDKLFQTALKLYNKLPKTVERWEYKGEVKACFQLCVSCRDVGKLKSFEERYYLDVLEVKKDRTILCKSCLGYLLQENVGSCVNGMST